MKNVLTTFLLLIFWNVSFCQEPKLPIPPIEEPEQVEPELFPEVQAEFPGGMDSLMNFILQHIEYPKVDKENEVEGKVYVRFIVETDGEISQIKVLKGVTPTMDKEAIRVIKLMPKWIPAKSNNKPVRSYFTIPIVFRLN